MVILPEAIIHSENKIFVILFFIFGFLSGYLLKLNFKFTKNFRLIQFYTDPLVVLTFISSSVHCLVDGILISISYNFQASVGIIMTLMIFIHEIPHQISKYNIFIKGIQSSKLALLMHMISIGFLILGVNISSYIHQLYDHIQYELMCWLSGIIFHLVINYLVPIIKINDQRLREILVNVTFILIGILLIYIVSMFHAHN